MDVLRGSAVLLIVAFHSTTLLRYAEVPPPTALAGINQAFAPFRIPLLVFLSGLLVTPSLAKGSRTYLTGKLKNVLYPYAIWLAVLALVQGSVHSWTFVVGGTYLWFLAFLFVYYVAAWILRGVPSAVVVLVALAASAIAPDDGKYSERLLFLFALFMLGEMASRWRQWERVTTSAVVTLMSAALLIAVTLTTHESSYGPSTLLQTLAGVLLAVALARRLAGRRWLAPVQFAGRNSIVFYVVHFPVIYVAAHLARRLGLEQSWALFLAVLVIALAAAMLLSHMRARVPIRWLFTPPTTFTWFPGKGRGA